MEEFLKIIYTNFTESDDDSCKAASTMINDSWGKVDDILTGFEETMSKKLHDELCDNMTEGINDIQEASFIAGFSYCAKFMSNGKIDFMGK